MVIDIPVLVSSKHLTLHKTPNLKADGQQQKQIKMGSLLSVKNRRSTYMMNSLLDRWRLEKYISMSLHTDGRDTNSMNPWISPALYPQSSLKVFLGFFGSIDANWSSIKWRSYKSIVGVHVHPKLQKFTVLQQSSQSSNVNPIETLWMWYCTIELKQ